MESRLAWARSAQWTMEGRREGQGHAHAEWSAGVGDRDRGNKLTMEGSLAGAAQ